MKTLSKTTIPFWEPLLDRLIEQLNAIQKEPTDNLQQQAQKAITVCSNLMNELQSHVLNYSFTEPAEEIYFFREVKPKFYSRLIYYHKMYNIEVGRPVGGADDLKKYFQKELNNIRAFFDDNKFYYLYFRSKETFLDEKLFLRNRQTDLFPSRIYDINSNPAFSTKCDYVFSRIYANELLLDYLNKKLLLINSGNIPVIHPHSKALTWTDAKVALIELAYAFKAKGSFNSGKATLKDITDFLQEAFNIELTNPPRDFQEILRRKTGYTSFLDSLKESYLKYIDAIENKDRR